MNLTARFKRVVAVLVMLPALLTGTASAQTIWIDGTGSWFNGSNWSAGVPASTTDGRVNNGGTVQIFGNSAQARNLILGFNPGDSGTLEVVSNGFLGDLTVAKFLLVGEGGSGTMRISAGASVSDETGYIGGLIVPFPPVIILGTGTVTVNGSNATWNNTGTLTILNGTLTVSNGGKVNNTNGIASSFAGLSTTTTVTGAGSIWTNTGTFGVGGDGTNTVTIADGGLVKVTGQATIFTHGLLNIGAGAGAGALQAASLLNDGSLQFNHTGAATFAAPLTGAGLVLKNGSGSSTITNAAGFTGAFGVNTGTLVLQNALGPNAFSSYGGTLRFDAATVDLGSSAIRVFSGAAEYKNTTVNGGFLRGSGTHTVLAGASATFNGVTTFNDTTIVQNGTATFNNFTNGGTLINDANASLTFDGVTNTSSGTVVLNGSLLAQDFSTDGVFVVNAGASLDNGGNDLVSGGGSRSTINSGGVIFLSDGTAWELNGALLVNNGEINGTVDVNYGSLAKGGGNFAGMVNVNDGGQFSPGNSPGSATLGAATFGAGGAYVFEMRDAAGAPGTGSDLIAVSGALDVAAGTTANSRFTIRIVSLDAANQPGPAANFDPSHAHSLKLLTAGGGITGFAASKFTFDHSAFQNDLAGGAFSIAQVGNELRVVFSPGVPGPTATAATATPVPTASATSTTVPTATMGGATATTTPAVPLPSPTPTPSVEGAHLRKCQTAIAKSSATFVHAKLAALARCRSRIATGKLTGICPDDDPTTALKIAAAATRLRDDIAKACGGKNKVCNAADVGADADVLRSDLGFPPACPGFAGACTDVIADRDCGDIATCLGCIGGAAVDQAIALAYGVTPADPKAAKPLNACQRAIGKSAVQLFAARSKALQTCWDKVSSGKIPGPCPDATKAAPALVKATSRLTTGIAAACCGKNKTCDLTDGGVDADFDPVTAIGFRTQCDTLVVPGGRACGGTITDMRSLIACVDCVTELDETCVTAAQRPAFVKPYPIECR